MSSLSINPATWSNDTKKNVSSAGIATGAIAGATVIHKTTKGKAFSWNTAINKKMKQIAASDKDFPEMKIIKQIAKKISKTSGRQKMLGTFTVGSLAAGIALREHFCNKNTAEAREELDNFKIDARKRDRLNNIRLGSMTAALGEKDAQIEEMGDLLAKSDPKSAKKLGIKTDNIEEKDSDFDKKEESDEKIEDDESEKEITSETENEVEDETDSEDEEE